eukprot:jgi/Tetstr1/427616/TSEL_017741.t1
MLDGDLVRKLRQSGAAATVVALAWYDRPWMPQLHDLATEVLHCPPATCSFPDGETSTPASGRGAGACPRPDAPACMRNHAPPGYALRYARSRRCLGAWAASMRTGAIRLFGADNIGQRAVDFLAASLKPRSVATYSSQLNLIMEFCALEGFFPMDADTPFIVRYSSWAADHGRNKARAFQPYLSAVNAFLHDHTREPVALGPMVNHVVNGLKLAKLAQSGRVGAKSVSDEDDYLAVPELLQRAESCYEAVRPVSRVPWLFSLSTDLMNEYLKHDDRRLPAQEEYLWMSCFGAHMVALFVALDKLMPYVHAAILDFTPYLARARNHAEAIDKAFRFRLAFLRRLNEVKRVHGDQGGVLDQLQDAGVDEDVAVDVGVAAKVSTSDGVGRLSSELLEPCEATFW